MKEWILEHKLSLFAGLALAAGGIFYYSDLPDSDVIEQSSIQNIDKSGENKTPVKAQDQKQSIDAQKPNTPLMVDIKGEVNHPGVYQSLDGERVIDLINKAGGMTDKADKNQVNLAQHIADEMVIFIPAIGQEPVLLSPVAGSGSTGHTPANGKPADKSLVNINTAGETELQTLPGIGPSKATAIMEYRETNGPFQKVEDLKQISGIGDKTYEKLQEYISVH
ncbi:helix-hairpin-helix domain-containing protein [Neobacillus terrae]|uniref:helix-hairpin-helix domain-containing protein n=1 Tax=Neobacillus terrae TaxID=3034837 RepID=UPI00140A6C59|nr:helix-hairpin-helix domain-containing protein [Neobacillus terrae]NHM30387.1 hypothetical protein [Neobacillus terrae]